MPRGNDIFPRGHGLQLKTSGRIGDTVKRMIDHAGVRAHPRMHVAAQRNHHLGLIERARLHFLDFRHAEIERFILLRRGVHVVKRRIAVENLQRLPDLDAEHARQVTAMMLIQNFWLSRRGVMLLRQAFLYIHEHIRQRVICIQHHVFGINLLFSLHGTGRILVHADWFRRRRLTFEKNTTSNRAASSSLLCGNNRIRLKREQLIRLKSPLGRGVRWRGLLVLTATKSKRQHGDQDQPKPRGSVG